MSAATDPRYTALVLARIENALRQVNRPEVQVIPAARRMLGWAICSWLDDLGPVGSSDWRRGAALINQAAQERVR